MRIPSESDYTPEWRGDDGAIMHGIRMSPEINEIATALNAALGDITEAPRTAKAHNYKYAPFEAVMPIIRGACAANGLFMLQTPWSPEKGQMGVCTLLTHKSGQWIQTQYAVPFAPDGKNIFHQTGTSTSYLRRYAAMSLFFMAQEDDDAQSQTVKPTREKFVPKKQSLLDELTVAANDGQATLDKAVSQLTRDQKLALSKSEKDALKQIAKDVSVKQANAPN